MRRAPRRRTWSPQAQIALVRSRLGEPVPTLRCMRSGTIAVTAPSAAITACVMLPVVPIAKIRYGILAAVVFGALAVWGFIDGGFGTMCQLLSPSVRSASYGFPGVATSP